MIRVISIVVASFLVLIVSGCANTVNKPTVQQHYLVVSMTTSGPIDLNNFRYFVFLKYNTSASGAVGPDLTNQINCVLSASGATVTNGIDGITTFAGAGPVLSNFAFDEFYEKSINWLTTPTFGTFVNQNSTANSAVIVVNNPNTTIQFSIPLNTASSPIGINVVTTNAINYLIQDYLSSGTIPSGYHLFDNTLGNTYSSSVIPTPSASPSADIVSWSASII